MISPRTLPPTSLDSDAPSLLIHEALRADPVVDAMDAVFPALQTSPSCFVQLKTPRINILDVDP